MIMVFVLLVLIFKPSSFDFSMIMLTALCKLFILFRPLATTQTSSANIRRSTPCGSSSLAMFSINILYKKGLIIPP